MTSHRRCRVRRLARRFDLFDIAAHWADRPYVVFLDSNDPSHPASRWSFVASDPTAVLRTKGERRYFGPPGGETESLGDPLELLRQITAGRRAVSTRSDDHPSIPFLGGALGYIGYELLHAIEEVPAHRREDHDVFDLHLGFFDSLVARDERSGDCYAIANGFGASEEEADAAADVRCSQLLADIAGAEPRSARPSTARRRRLTAEDLERAAVRPVLDHDEYVHVVETAKEHIRAGDVFEVCTCNRFDTTFDGDSTALYAALRASSPAPFAALVRLAGVDLLSSSPERFLSLDSDGWAESRPIKGTRPRAADEEEDRRLAKALAESEKDRAENIMIVDLVRNDLGRVCAFGTVEVPKLQVIESFAFTHQMVSTIRGRLRPGLDEIDLFRAAFPPGSMTGAPKIEAMKIIAALEPVKRGIFSGSIGYIGDDGRLDLNIVIRTLIRAGNELFFHTGGAIVADSDPEEEYRETLDKAAGLVAAIQLEAGTNEDVA